MLDINKRRVKRAKMIKAKASSLAKRLKAHGCCGMDQHMVTPTKLVQSLMNFAKGERRGKIHKDDSEVPPPASEVREFDRCRT